MALTPEALLAGPRGRHLCLAVAHRLHEPVWGAWLESAWHPNDPTRLAALASALAEVQTTELASWREPEAFTGAVGESVSRAMYWQAPDDQDMVAAQPSVVAALLRIAEAVCAAPGAEWWPSRIDLEGQRYTSHLDSGEVADEPVVTGSAEKLTHWKQQTLADNEHAHRDRPDDPTAPYGGSWWSTPTGAGLLRTTRALPSVGAVQLLWEEDGLDQDEALVWEVHALRTPRVYEIHDAAAWTELVRRYPLDVTWGRRHDWYRATSRIGSWLIPDWKAVSQDWDAVHLSVIGYLATATRSLPVDDVNATMLAGWDPDETFWLTDTITIGNAAAQPWRKLGAFGSADDEWIERPIDE